jgi:hypothetical protein
MKNSIIFPYDDPDRVLAKIRALHGDLSRLVRDGGPSAADLANAPVLTSYRRVTRPTPALLGRVHGHPNIADGHRALTTQIFAFDPDGDGWARSYSRFYTLGRPAAGDDDCGGIQ